MQELTISSAEAGQRFDKFLKKYLDGAPSGFLYRMLRKKNITLNGRKAEGGALLKEGDTVRLFLSDETIASFQKHAYLSTKEPGIRPEILYEDEDIVAVNKPAGLLVQPDRSGNASLSDLLPSLLLGRGTVSEQQLRAFRPAPLQRLDRNTSGIVLCGKSLRGAQFLADSIREGSIRKEYAVIACGAALSDGIRRAYIRKNTSANTVEVTDGPCEGAVPAVTGIRVIDSRGPWKLLRVRLYTGRTHQIRAHLAHLGCPVAGDPKYGDPAVNRRLKQLCGISRQMLHAERVAFPENASASLLPAGLSLRADLPPDFLEAAEKTGLRAEMTGRGSADPI